MSTLDSPEIAQALADCEPGEIVTLAVKGTCTADKTLEVESVLKQSYEDGEEPLDDQETLNRPMKMPKGVAILVAGKPSAKE